MLLIEKANYQWINSVRWRVNELDAIKLSGT
jgi:hypothetical protein